MKPGKSWRVAPPGRQGDPNVKKQELGAKQLSTVHGGVRTAADFGAPKKLHDAGTMTVELEPKIEVSVTKVTQIKF